MNRLNHIVKHISSSNEDLDHTALQKADCSIETNEYGGFLIAKVLLSEGVKCIFTLTGGHISPMLVGCNKLGIKVIDVRDEVTTVFAADAVGRLTGKPGIAMVTAGPGLTNTITAVKNAQMAESPCIVFGGASHSSFPISISKMTIFPISIQCHIMIFHFHFILKMTTKKRCNIDAAQRTRFFTGH